MLLEQHAVSQKVEEACSIYRKSCVSQEVRSPRNYPGKLNFIDPFFHYIFLFLPYSVNDFLFSRGIAKHDSLYGGGAFVNVNPSPPLSKYLKF